MLVLEHDKVEDQLKNRVCKLDEEVCEVIHAERCESKERLAEEVLDCMQVCIGILDKLSEEGIDMEEEFEKHMLKIMGRGWRWKKLIEINILKGNEKVD